MWGENGVRDTVLSWERVRGMRYCAKHSRRYFQTHPSQHAIPLSAEFGALHFSSEAHSQVSLVSNQDIMGEISSDLYYCIFFLVEMLFMNNVKGNQKRKMPQRTIPLGWVMLCISCLLSVMPFLLSVKQSKISLTYLSYLLASERSFLMYVYSYFLRVHSTKFKIHSTMFLRVGRNCPQKPKVWKYFF